MVAIKEAYEAGRFASAARQVIDGGAQVDLKHVLESDSDPKFVAADEMVRDGVEQFEARGFVADGHVRPVTDGDVASRLARHAEEIGADLVVMGSRGLGHLGGLLGRSVSHALMAQVDIPVLVVPREAQVSMHGIRRILVAVADEGDADMLVKTLQQVGGKAELTLVHVPRLVGVHLEGRPRDRFAEILEASPVVLQSTLQHLRTAGLEASTRTLQPHGSVPTPSRPPPASWRPAQGAGRNRVSGGSAATPGSS